MFSTFLKCSQMSGVFYHSVIHGLGFFICFMMLYSYKTWVSGISFKLDFISPISSCRIRNKESSLTIGRELELAFIKLELLLQGTKAARRVYKGVTLFAFIYSNF